jgi:ribosomal protein S17E
MKCGECGRLFIINRVLDAHATVRTKRVRNCDAPWITSDIRDMMFHRDYLSKLD